MTIGGEVFSKAQTRYSCGMSILLSKPFPLVEKQLTIAGRLWNLTLVEDQNALMDNLQTDEDLENFPYGLMLWPSALGG